MNFSRIFLGILLFLAVSFGQVVYVWLPDTIAGGQVGDTLSVPILISGQAGLGVIAADIILSFPESSLIALDSCRLGNAVPGNWLLEINPLPCSVLIAMAGVDPLIDGDTLLVTYFVLNTPETTRIRFTRCLLNEGQVPCSTRSGLVGMEQNRIEPIPTYQFGISPNPITRNVKMHCCLNAKTNAKLDIIDDTGRLVRNLLNQKSATGEFSVSWDGRDKLNQPVATGVYFCQLQTGNAYTRRKLVVLRN